MSIHNGREFIKEVKRSPENFYIIHYSCESLYDDNSGLSPKITAIVVMHVATDQTVSFATHILAEELRIGRGDVPARFEEIEGLLLKKFFEFVRDRKDKYWIHWNMRNIVYGFEHLEHRYQVLNSVNNPPVIPVERRLNLNDLISDRYGTDYAAHPKFQSLMDLNGGLHRHFLSGKDEVAAFHAGEFISMHNSTLSKVSFLRKVIERMVNGKLKVASRGAGVILDRFFEGRVSKGVALTAGTIGILVSIYQIYLWII